MQREPKHRANVRSSFLQAEPMIKKHYGSDLVMQIRAGGDVLELAHTKFILADEFGFCNGVQRAVQTAYATRCAYADSRIFLIGEIIHNPEVNKNIAALDIHTLPWKIASQEYDILREGDVVIVPAFGVPTDYLEFFREKGVIISDTTCGDVMRVWYQVRRYADKGITSVIHGKASHEETLATASQAMGKEGKGKYIIVFSTEDVQCLVDYILGKGDKIAFMERFKNAMSTNFNPDEDLRQIGVSNQTTMLKSETIHVQNMLKAAIMERDGNADNCMVSDTICGATQARQDALFQLLTNPLDTMFVVGGYNSSNTTHLVEIAQKHTTTYFINSAQCLESITHFNSFSLSSKKEERVATLSAFQTLDKQLTIGITAGASCPSNVIDGVIRRICELRHESL